MVYRNCRAAATRDGYCTGHHPDNIEAALMRAEQQETLDDMREIQRKEEAIVGRFMRRSRPDDFAAILERIQEARRISDEMRYAP